MFKYLAKKNDDPGFANAIVLTNTSQHWLELDDSGRRLPPRSHAAMDASLVAESRHIPNHIEEGLLTVSSSVTPTQPAKAKRRKKAEEAEAASPIASKVEVVSEPAPPIQDSSPFVEVSQEVVEPEVQVPTTLVADTAHDNWVSSNENKVGEPTQDQI
jgi:hypothetical protein